MISGDYGLCTHFEEIDDHVPLPAVADEIATEEIDEAIIEVSGVSKRFGTSQALSDVSMRVPAGDSRAEFSSSEYAKTTQGIVAGVPPAIDLAAEKRLIECLVSLASAGLILSAHDVSDGGLAVTIAESCFASEGLSADVTLSSSPAAEERSLDSGSRPRSAREDESARASARDDDTVAEVAFFGERGARAVVSLSAASLARLNAVAAQYGVAANRIGTVTRSEFRIQFNGTPVIRGDMSSFRKVWSESLAAATESGA